MSFHIATVLAWLMIHCRNISVTLLVEWRMSQSHSLSSMPLPSTSTPLSVLPPCLHSHVVIVLPSTCPFMLSCLLGSLYVRRCDVYLWAWLISPNRITSRSIRFPTNDIISFLMAETVLYVYVYT